MESGCAEEKGKEKEKEITGGGKTEEEKDAEIISLKDKIADLQKQLLQAQELESANKKVKVTHGEEIQNRMNWGDVFMLSAIMLAHRSKHEGRRVGCVLVRSSTNQIVGYGFNGLPSVIENDQVIEWPEEEKNGTVIHAESNALLHRNGYWGHEEIHCYVTLIPCYCCAEKLIQAGIKKVWYLYDDDKYEPSKKLLKDAQVKFGRWKFGEKKKDKDSKNFELTNGEIKEWLTKFSPDFVSYLDEFWQEFREMSDELKFSFLFLDHKRFPKRESDPEKKKPFQVFPRLTWNQVFMGLAQLAVGRCRFHHCEVPGSNKKDPYRKVYRAGCVLLGGNKKIISLAYTGRLNPRSGELGSDGIEDTYICGEENALIFANSDTLNSILYTTKFPCKKCARLLVQAKISTIYYIEDAKNNPTDMKKDEEDVKNFFLPCEISLKKFSEPLASGNPSNQKHDQKSKDQKAQDQETQDQEAQHQEIQNQQQQQQQQLLQVAPHSN